MDNSRYDPDLIHQRRLIINTIIAVIILFLALYGWIWITHYHRTPTSRQQALLTSNEPVVVMFYSKSCPDCRKIAATVNRSVISGQATNEIRSLAGDSSKKHQVMFIEYQNKHDRILFDRYNVTKKPTLMVLRQGQPQLIENNNSSLIYQYVSNDKRQVKAIYYNLQMAPLLK